MAPDRIDQYKGQVHGPAGHSSAALDTQLTVSVPKLLLSFSEGSGKTLVFAAYEVAQLITLTDQIIVFSGRPGCIRPGESSSPPRPRNAIGEQFSSEFLVFYQRLWALLAPDIESAVTEGQHEWRAWRFASRVAFGIATSWGFALAQLALTALLLLVWQRMSGRLIDPFYISSP